MLTDKQKMLIYDAIANMIVAHYYWFSEISEEQQRKDIEQHAKELLEYIERVLNA